MDLKTLTTKAKQSQSFIDPKNSELKEKPQRPTRKRSNNTKSTQPKTKTANSKIREELKLQRSSLTSSQKQAKRREYIAQLYIEVSIEQKKELLEASLNKNVSLKQEVLDRLFN